MLRKIISCFLFCLSCNAVFAQVMGNIHTKQIALSADTLTLDTLSLVPNSITLKTENTTLDTSFYKINYADGSIIFNRKKLTENNIKLDNLKATYKTFPYLFSSETKHKDITNIHTDLQGNINPFNYKIESKSDDIFKMDGLNKSGSISRGISFGNNQDMVVNSNLNLQLSGHLSNNVDILLAATDNNIPIQAEGNTQQLQEFDKVFIQLSTANTKLIAGDFVLKRPTSYFMNFNKKAQGVSFSTAVKTNKDNKNKEKQGLYATTLSAAVSRGKFARNQLQGIESNQGPYRLRGAENELFIIILSGTEKVYIDGRLVERGQENDYTINYNTGEIIFTAKQLITKDKRIVVEFQYSDKNFVRSLVHFGNDYEQGKLKLHLNIYSEQDSKNQPLQQSLSDEQKILLSQIGDTLSLAIAPSFDSVPFSNSEVLYKKIDTTVGSTIYSNTFVYNTDSTNIKKYYRVTFSNVGQGNGNYIQVNSSANGKVFQWILPDTTVIPYKPRGSYEPVIQLITPKKKQMLSAAVEYAFSKNSKLFVEGAVSNNVLNTFSNKSTYDDVGYSLKANFDNTQTLSKTKSNDSIKHQLKLITNINYEYVQKYFSPIERFRTTEFERDWNKTSTTIIPEDQHIIGAGVALADKNSGTIGYRFNAFLQGTQYNANKHDVNFNLSKKGFIAKYDGSLLNSSSTQNTNFYRHKSLVSQNLKWLNIGLKDEFEQNKFTINKKDSLLSNSYQFWEWQAFAQNADTTKNRYGINYKQRTDYAVKADSSTHTTSLNKSAFAQSFGAFIELIKNQNNQLKINTTYRILEVNSKLSSQTPDNSLVGRIEYNFKLWKGFIYSNSFYEIGSGLEVKKQYSYLEVAAGQGVYTWVDRNENGIKELSEFEISNFPDQATYIKIYTPTSDYIKTYNNQFSEVLTLKPAAMWASKTGFKKFMTRFSNQTSYRVDRKTMDNDLSKAYNPFLGIINDSLLNDSNLVTLNSAFRNTLYINQLSSVFGLDLTYQDARNRALLVNGIDSRQNTYTEARLRWNISQKINWMLTYKDGYKGSKSQYFSTRNYLIRYVEVEPKINFQPNTAFRLSLSFKYTDKKNSKDFGNQHAVLQDYGAEIKYNVLNKGSLNLKGNYIQIAYDDVVNSSVAFEMLDALRIGKNITWGLSYQRNLSNNLQLSITYDGRYSEGSKTIHTGGAQVRAYF